MLNKQQVLNTCKEIPIEQVTEGDYTIHQGVVAKVMRVTEANGRPYYVIGALHHGVQGLTMYQLQRMEVKAYRLKEEVK